jgi:hypothetical protein
MALAWVDGEHRLKKEILGQDDQHPTPFRTKG